MDNSGDNPRETTTPLRYAQPGPKRRRLPEEKAEKFPIAAIFFSQKLRSLAAVRVVALTSSCCAAIRFGEGRSGAISS